MPPALALRSDMIVLPDRCTISDLRGYFRDREGPAGVARDFIECLAGEGVRINPLLWALEGNRRRSLTVEEVEQQVEEAAAVLKKALPKAELVAVNAHGVQGTAGLIRDSLAGMMKKERFLMRLAPKLHAPVGARKRDLLWREVLSAAADCGLPRKSLVVLAALCCVSVPNGCGAARGVLKITRHYSKEDAYNALSDLRALELLMALFAVFPGSASYVVHR